MIATVCLIALAAAPQQEPDRDFIVLDPNRLVRVGSGLTLPFIPNGYRKGDPIPYMPGAGEPLLDREDPLGRSYYIPAVQDERP